MAHEIDELAPGIHAAAFACKDAWHQLGTTLPAELTAEDVMTHAHLGGWDVRKIPLTATELTEAGVTSLEVPDRWATVRTNPVTRATEYLGTVGGHYTPIQNEAHTELLNALVDESGAHFDTAGSLRKGREVFISMKLPNHLTIGGADRIDLNLVALNSHDGSSAFRFLVSPTRVVCANTQAAALRDARSQFSIRHTGGAAGKLQEAREALGLTFKYVEAFEAEAERMLARPVTPIQADDLFWELLEIQPGEFGKASPRTRQHAMSLSSLWSTSSTLEGIRDTRWGAYQAVTEYLDHFAPVRGANAGRARATRTLTSHAANKMKERAFALASA